MPTESIPIQLEHPVEIYVPTLCRCGKPLPEAIQSEALEDVKSNMGEWFGGGSIKKVDIRVERIDGFWASTNGDSANEPVDVVYSYTTKEALEEHFEELATFTAGLANRLTQETVACRVDGTMRTYPSTEDPKPHRCAGGLSSGELPTPLKPNELSNMRALQASLQRISSVRDARDLFCNVLHYEFEDEQMTTVNWPDKLKEYLALGTSPQIIADQNGFKIIYLQLSEDYLRKGLERQLVQHIAKDDPTLRSLVVVSDVDQKQWHLINVKFEKEEGKQERLRLRRMHVGPDQSVRTAVERLTMLNIETAGENTTAAELQDLHDRAFDVESVSREFFNEISNWYFWALSQVEFPVDTLTDDDSEKHRATSLIRFLTRMIFCWFLKEKGLIPANLFRQKDLADILVDLDPDSCTYHQGILQNLFFATLNQRMGKDNKGKPYRAFAKDEGFLKNRSTYGVDTLYRYEEHFQDSDAALSHFADIPFLNGGLFECLDYTEEETGEKLYVDGFSRNKKKRARVPNCLFFASEQTVDLSEVYGDTRRRNARVRGLLNILHSYNFTIEENTPVDEEIALDPELLGKVFENLLASYNEETKTTARKQTGSFYTPRPIVEYMVDESLNAHLGGTLTQLGHKEEEAREQLELLLGYTDEEPTFSEEEISALLEAIHTCKILDPACGSGAFPIGMLHKLVHIVHKLDPDNARWKQLQIDEASKIPDSSARNAAIKAIKQDFEDNGDDYGRKLYLIENCLYGVDIQPIAIQISKLRFFISLICDQRTNRDKAKNHGIRALPNLETKFVAANTLISLPEMDQMALVSPRVHEIESEIESLYHRHFSIQRRDQKRALEDKLKDLRKELGRELAESLGSSQKAQQLAGWDPFNPQVSSDFFDPHWMFGQSLADGFDIVIANPPYVFARDSASKGITQTAKDYYYGNYSLAEYQVNLYPLFIEAGSRVLRKRGVLCFITPNNWLTINTNRNLRRFVLAQSNVSILNFYARVFESADVDAAIVIFQNDDSASENKYVRLLEWITEPELITEALTSLFLSQQDAIINIEALKSGATRDLMEKIESKSRDLRSVASVKCGLKAYQKGKGRPKQSVREKEGRVFHSKTPKHGYIKYLDGKDVCRYRLGWNGEFLHYGPHLAEPRKDFRLFSTPRILVRQIPSPPPYCINACYTDETVLNDLNSMNVINLTIKHQLLLAVLNSRLMTYWFIHKFGKMQRGIFPQFKVNELAIFPISISFEPHASRLIELVESVLNAKQNDANADTSETESEIDQLVYSLYGLTAEEAEIIEDSLAE